MRRIRQRASNDCFSACVASLLGLELKAVPNLYQISATGDDMYCRMQRWLRRHHGMSLVTIIRPERTSLRELLARTSVTARFIASVPVIGGDWHAVVAGVRGKRVRLLHDPGDHPRINLRHAADISFLIQAERTQGA